MAGLSQAGDRLCLRHARHFAHGLVAALLHVFAAVTEEQRKVQPGTVVEVLTGAALLQQLFGAGVGFVDVVLEGV